MNRLDKKQTLFIISKERAFIDNVRPYEPAHYYDAIRYSLRDAIIEGQDFSFYARQEVTDEDIYHLFNLKPEMFFNVDV